MELFESAEQIIVSAKSTSSCLVVDRASREIKFEPKDLSCISYDKKQEIVGVIGYVSVDQIAFLVVALRGEKVGAIRDQPIFRLADYSIVPVAGVGSSLYCDAEAHIKFVLSLESFYYAPDFDITRSMQSRSSNPKECDERYFINSHLSDPLRVNDESSAFVLPLILGFYEEKELTLKDETKVKIAVLSRRSRHRMGIFFFLDTNLIIYLFIYLYFYVFVCMMFF